MPGSGRLVQLDGLRGLAALLVVGYHYTTRFQELYGHPAPLPFGIPLGHYGVQLFFMVSGFVIFMTLLRMPDWRDFLVSRLARLFPAYWAAVLLTWLVVWTCSLPGRQVPVPDMLVNLSMIQEWLGTPHVDGVYWTLTVELAFYAIVLGLFALGGLRHLRPVACVWLGAMLLVHGAQSQWAFRLPDIVKTSLLLEHANLFLAGMLLHQMYGQERDRLTVGLLVACLVVEFVLHGTEAGLVCTAFFALFGALVRSAGPLNIVLSWAPIVSVGTISYSLYLLHQNIGYVLLRGLYATGAAPTAAIAVTAVVVLALATGFHRLIEVPGRRVIRDAWRKHRERPGRTTA